MSVLTKVFIVLQMVFSLALAVLVVFTLGSVPNYKKQVEDSKAAQISAAAAATHLQVQLVATQQQLAAAISGRSGDASTAQTTIADLTSQLATLQRERDRISGEAATDKANLTASVLSVNAMTDQLSARDKELASSRPEVLKLTAQNAELNRTNASLQTQLDSADHAIRTLQEEIAKASTTGPAAGIGSSDNQTATLSTGVASTPINGKVTNISDFEGRTYITLSLGTRDKVVPNTRFTVYRGNVYIGDAVVTKSTIDQSVAVVTLTKPGEAVKTDDLVISGAGF